MQRQIIGQQKYNVSDPRHLKKMMGLSFVVYGVLCALFWFKGYHETIPLYMEMVRLLVFFYAACMTYLSFFRINANKFLISNSVVFFLLVLCIRWIYSSEGLDFYGNAIDSYNYLDAAVKYADKSLNEYYHILFNMRYRNYGTDDMGYFTVTYLVAQINPSRYFVIYALVVINAVALYVSSLYLYKLQKLLGATELIARVTSVFYSCTPFLVITAVSGLKEVIFLMIVILAMYHIYKVYRRLTFTHLFLALLFMTLTLFFRTAIFYILLLSLFSALTTTRKYRNIYLTLIFVAGIFVVSFMPLLIGIMGASTDELLRVTMGRFAVKGYNDAFITKFVLYAASVFGPFPILDRMGMYAFMLSLTPFQKCFFSMAFVYSLVSIVRKVRFEYFPILIYIVLSIYMLILGGVSLDMRYHLTYYPFFLICTFNFYRKHKYMDWIYLFAVVVMIFIYGSRNLG